MSVMEESTHKFLEQKAQGSPSSSLILKPETFFWDRVIFSLAVSIFGLSISGVILEFFKSDEDSLACFSPFENRAQYTYINSYCRKHLPRGEYFPLLLVLHVAVLVLPHYFWKVFASTEFDFFFSHIARVEILREGNTGKYPHQNYRIVNYLKREFGNRMHILVAYLIKLSIQISLVIVMIIVNVVWFMDINDVIIFKCSDDDEGNQVFGSVTCTNPRKLYINILQGTDLAILIIAAIILVIGLLLCCLRCCSKEDYEDKTAKFCYDSCIDPQYYYKPSMLFPISWFRINNDFSFLLASLNFGLVRVFKTIQIEKKISELSGDDLQKLAQGK